MKRFSVKPADLIAAALILAIGLALFILRDRSERVTASVSVNGEVLYTFDLGQIREETRITLPNGVELELCPGAIGFASSPCRGQDCVRFGRLTKPGQAAACLPNRTLITLTGAPASDVPDAVSY